MNKNKDIELSNGIRQNKDNELSSSIINLKKLGVLNNVIENICFIFFSNKKNNIIVKKNQIYNNVLSNTYSNERNRIIENFFLLL